jgi:uncharacterized RDD family membrane protein YckC
MFSLISKYFINYFIVFDITKFYYTIAVKSIKKAGIMFSDHFANPVDFTPAPLQSRSLAYIIDKIILFLFWFAIVYFIYKCINSDTVSSFTDSIDNNTSAENPGAVSKSLQILFISIFFFAAYIVMLFPVAFTEYLLGGRSPGKLIVGIRVESSNGENPSLFQILFRSVLRDIEGLIGLIFILATPYRQTFYDTLTGTVVTQYRFKEIDKKDKIKPEKRSFILNYRFQHNALQWQRFYNILFSSKPPTDRVRIYLVNRAATQLAADIPPLTSRIPVSSTDCNLVDTEKFLLSFSNALDTDGVRWENH